MQSGRRHRDRECSSKQDIRNNNNNNNNNLLLLLLSNNFLSCIFLLL